MDQDGRKGDEMECVLMMVWKIKKINKCIYELKYGNKLKK
ncbi:unnamed protein product [Paramecium pentaurelia]|uniref:Uncharacterized protein n=1 Tax=Paramecium pentaurelia TaxID=43138 RepID=A0A8S1X086_9CILI|nr:unnamed protein product [Paramecium pentaurelia]